MTKGFIPAAFTPFNHALSLNQDAIPNMGQFYIKQGISTVFVNGTTGEFSSLTLRERELTAETWLSQPHDLQIWVHVGHTSQPEAIRLARHAQKHGAAAISALAPYYFKPGNEHLLVQFLTPIAGAASALPFYYYHIPSLTGVQINLPAFVQLAQQRIPTFKGVKYSSTDLYTLQLLNQSAPASGHPRCDVLFGVDEMVLGAFPFGIVGAIGSTYNFSIPLYKSLLAAYEASDMQQARKLQALSASLVRLFHTYGGISTGKAIMRLLDVPCGSVRPPLPELSAKEINMIYDHIRYLDIFPHAPALPTP